MEYKRRAFFSDTTRNYVFPEEPKPYAEVTIRFRTGKGDVDTVCMISKEKEVFMTWAESDTLFDYYEVKIQLSEEKYSYCFRIKSGDETCFYDFRGSVWEPSEEYAFQIIPGFSIPEWAKSAVMYQIYVDRFCNGDKENDVLDGEYAYLEGPSVRVPEKEWNKYPERMGVREFYGGDLQGVMDKLDYLAELGIEVIYFNPLFVSPSNHKYDTQDYDYIDPHIGKIVCDGGELLVKGDLDNSHATKYIKRVTDFRNLEAGNELFAKLVEKAHEKGIRVIMDGVFNHCGSFHKWLDREKIYRGEAGYETGAYHSPDSPYRNRFLFHDEHAWPENGSYEGWWGHSTLPKLNYEGSEELCEDILRIGEKWVSAPFYADGWRLDVAADLGGSPEFNHRFWQRFRERVKKANPDALIIAEHYGDASAWLQGKEWDTVMNYDAFMEPVTWFLTGMQKHSDDYREDMLNNGIQFWSAMHYHQAKMTTPSLESAMNELSNHDHSRFLTRTGGIVGRVEILGSETAEKGIRKEVMREAVLIQFTWPGSPTVYYGDEASVCGFTDPDNRRTYPWGREDMEMVSFHREMIRLHREREELKYGSICPLAADYGVIAYARFTEKAVSFIAVNNLETEVTQDFLVWIAGVPRNTSMERRMLTTKEGYTGDLAPYTIKDGTVTFTMPPRSGILLTYEKQDITQKLSRVFPRRKGLRTKFRVYKRLAGIQTVGSAEKKRDRTDESKK